MRTRRKTPTFLPIRVARGHGASRQPRPLDTSLITARLVTAGTSLCAPSRTITWRDPGYRKSVRATLRLRAWRAGPHLRKPSHPSPGGTFCSSSSYNWKAAQVAYSSLGLLSSTYLLAALSCACPDCIHVITSGTPASMAVDSPPPRAHTPEKSVVSNPA